MHRLVFTERAQADLLEAWLHIAEDNLAAADKVLDTLEQEAKLLLLQPLMGRARPELGSAARSWPSANEAPYRFVSVEKLVADFLADVERAKNERNA